MEHQLCPVPIWRHRQRRMLGAVAKKHHGLECETDRGGPPRLLLLLLKYRPKP